MASLTPDSHLRLFRGRPLASHDWDGVLVNGEETTEQLRQIASASARACPRGQNHERCPFRWLEALDDGQRQELIEHIDRNALLQLFAMEQACRFEIEHPRPVSAQIPLV